jgi:NAD(P)-dependent dehydrogenase (short-subunit alcohol dehydrogenase family)
LIKRKVINMPETKKASPNEQHARPPFPKQSQEPPGLEGEMQPRPDHGEHSYQGFDRLKDKVALITGADSGIGKAVAIAYAREGADVLVSFLSETEDAEATAKWIHDAGRKAVLAPGDIGDEDHCRNLVDHCYREFGRLDLLVNNAAHQATHDRLEDWTSEEWRYMFRTNIDAMFYLCKAALPRMSPGAAIINTTSIQAYNPSSPLLAYSTTKGAIVTFTQGLAGLAAERGIRVNAVAPGPVWTPLIPISFAEEKVREFGKNTMIGRPAQPVEMVPAYIFLSLPDSTYVTGSIVDMTGGRLIH